MASHAVVLANRPALETQNRLSASFIGRVRQTLEALAEVGVREVAVVDGHHAEQLRDGLKLHELPMLNVAVIANASWRNLSGSAVLLARSWIEASPHCLVLNGDRPLDAHAMRLLVQIGEEHPAASAALLVATACETSPGTDVRVALRSEVDTGAMFVQDIGPDLDAHDGVFTGHALITPAILPILAALPNPTLDDALHELVTLGKVVSLTSGSWTWAARRTINIEDKVTALLEAKRHARYTLLNPGPVNTSANVKSALVHYDVCHRDPVFSELMVAMTGKLRRIYRGTPQHTVVAITGSGTAAMESALVSTVPPDKKVLIVDNGAFGTRLVEVASAYQQQIVHLQYAWGQTVNPADVATALEAHPDIAVVAMIHHETSVGLLNPVREIGALCRAHDALLVVDAVSSLGAEDIDVVRDNIDVCYGSSNKALHAVSGVSFMCVAPRVWPRIDALKPHAYYLDLRRYRKYMDEVAQTPFTPAVSAYFALDAACAEFLADGHRVRFELYRERNRRLRTGLAALGMPSFTATGHESHSIVTARLPDGVSFSALYDAVKARGIIIYGCKGILADRYVQIANMGELSLATIDDFLVVLGEELVRHTIAPATVWSEQPTHPIVPRAAI